MNKHKKQVINLIDDQLKYYSLDIFSKPDLKKAAKVLKENNMIIDNITADNFRCILNIIRKRIIEEL